MKKYYSSHKYKKFNKNRSRKALRKRKKIKKYDPVNSQIYFQEKKKWENVSSPPIIAEGNLKLLDKPEKCTVFFEKMKSKKFINRIQRISFIRLDLSLLKEVDFSAVCIMSTIIHDNKTKGIYTQCILPENEDCKKVIIDSGLINNMRNKQGEKFEAVSTSDQLLLKKGSEKLETEDRIFLEKIAYKAFKIVKYDKEDLPDLLHTILLEICGNSIEWSGTKSKQWLIGAKYEEDRVIFTLSDVGLGVIKTLRKNDFQLIRDKVISNISVLQGAFEGKYSSKSGDSNRNQGLPTINNAYQNGLLQNLKVLTNNVILHFDDSNKSRTLLSKNEYKGTFYRWIINNDSLKYNEKNISS